MTILDQQYALVPTKLHEALLTSPATKADAAAHMVATGGLTLPQAALEVSIDKIIEDLGEQMVLSPADYSTLLSRHAAVAPATALRVLRASGRRVILHFLGQQLDAQIAVLQQEVSVTQAVKAGAISEWTALSGAQRAAIPNIFALGNDYGIPCADEEIADKQAQIVDLQARRAALP